MHRISGFLICSCFLALFFSSEATAGGGMVDENMRVTKEKENLEHEQELVRKAESEANDEPSEIESVSYFQPKRTSSTRLLRSMSTSSA